MPNISIEKVMRPISLYLFCITLFIAVGVSMGLPVCKVFAQEATPVPSPSPSPSPTVTPTPDPGLNPTVVTKTTVVFVGKEVIEILKLEDSNELLLAGTNISAVIDDSEIASVNIFNPLEDDQIIVEGSVLIAKTGENGQRTFVINGLAPGTTKIEFEVIDDDDTIDNVIEVVNVEVIELDAIIETDDNLGVAPFTVQFFDRSVGNIESRLWSFGDAADTTSDERNPTHVFADSGLFNVTLELTRFAASIGTVTASATVPICVVPSDSPGLPGVIFGTVFNPDSNLPINNAEIIMLSGDEEKKVLSKRDGTYRFENVLPGTVIFTVCKSIFYDCIRETLSYDGGSLPKNFELILKPEFQQPESQR